MTVAPGDNTGAKPAERLSVCGRKAANSKLVESADAVLRRAVLARLIADPLVSTGHIGVAAIAGQVTLTGYVTSNAQKDAAGAATRRVKGVEQVADASEPMKQLTAYIVDKVIKRKGVEINEDTPLVSSGLVDSFAMIEIFMELQRVAGRKIPASKVQAKDMDTVRLMFAMAEKFGKPAKS